LVATRAVHRSYVLTVPFSSVPPALATAEAFSLSLTPRRGGLFIETNANRAKAPERRPVNQGVQRQRRVLIQPKARHVLRGSALGTKNKKITKPCCNMRASNGTAYLLRLEFSASWSFLTCWTRSLYFSTTSLRDLTLSLYLPTNSSRSATNFAMASFCFLTPS